MQEDDSPILNANYIQICRLNFIQHMEIAVNVQNIWLNKSEI